MKICILTQPLHTNYGGLLQAWALQTVLKRLGHEAVTDRDGVTPVIPPYARPFHFGYHLLRRHLLGDKRYNPFRYLFTSLNNEEQLQREIAVHTDAFIAAHIDTVSLFPCGTRPDPALLGQFDAFVVGSDQVWRPEYNKHQPATFLDFASGRRVRRIAYAASFGVDHINEYTPSQLRTCAALLQQFDAVSVREAGAVALCREHFGTEALQLPDPTLLLDAADYLTLATLAAAEKTAAGDKLMCYILDKSPAKAAVADAIAQAHQLEILRLMPAEHRVYKMTGSEGNIFAPVGDWIAGFRDARYVITDSFHGTVFAILFRKPFVTLVNERRGASRFHSLLQLFDLESRIITDMDEAAGLLEVPISWDNVSRILQTERERALQFLTSAL